MNSVKFFFVKAALSTAAVLLLPMQGFSVQDYKNTEGDHIEGVIKEKSGDVKFKADKMFFESKDKVKLQNKVNIVTPEGLSLKTDVLNWNKASGKVKTNDKVVLTKQGIFNAKAKGMEVDTSSRQTVLKKNVTVKIPQKDSGFIFVTCDGPLEIDYNKSQAVFHNNVKISSNDMVLYSDKARLFFDAQGKTIEKMVAEGNVRIIKGKNTSYSQKATYIQTTKKIILEGTPRLILFPGNN